MNRSTDAELVARVLRGDREAADELLERYLRGCRTVALAILGDTDEAADACQDAFVAAIDQLDRCREPDRFGKWLLQIVRHRARDVLKSKRYSASVSLDCTVLSIGGLQLEQASLAERRARLLCALMRLPEAQREAVMLHDLEGWTHAEIAERSGLPHGTVRSHVHHGRKKLRMLLPEFDPIEELK